MSSVGFGSGCDDPIADSPTEQDFLYPFPLQLGVSSPPLTTFAFWARQEDLQPIQIKSVDGGLCAGVSPDLLELCKGRSRIHSIETYLGLNACERRFMLSTRAAL